jgi:hypothetical protein
MLTKNIQMTNVPIPYAFYPLNYWLTKGHAVRKRADGMQEKGDNGSGESSVYTLQQLILCELDKFINGHISLYIW